MLLLLLLLLLCTLCVLASRPGLSEHLPMPNNTLPMHALTTMLCGVVPCGTS
jgi:hypothetical protein